MASNEIHAIQTVSGNQPRMRRLKEAAAQTYKAGVPLQINASGFIVEWDGTTLAAAIAGFSKEFGANLTVAGVAQTLTFGSVPFESSAVNIPRGAPINDGLTGIEVADQDSVFLGQVGPAQGAVQADIGVAYGMTKDTDGHWFVDRTKIGASAVVRVIKLDPNDQAATVRGVYFTILAAASQLVA